MSKKFDKLVEDAMKYVRQPLNRDTPVDQNDYMAQQKAKKGQTWNQPDVNPTKIPLRRGLIHMGALGNRPQVRLEEEETTPPDEVSKPMGKKKLRYKLNKS